MDFRPQMNPVFAPEVAMPYFMAYPEYPCIGKRMERREDAAWEDFENLRRTYPAALRKWQRRVEEILDKMDYEGSMIYDEYPDRISLQNLSESVSRILESKADPLERAYLDGLSQVLVCNEIYRRRQKRKQETNGRITKGFGCGTE